MDNLKDIKLQNLTDGWSQLYMYLAKNIMAVCGRRGEGIVRRAIVSYGNDQGTMLREQHLASGIPINLKNLYAKTPYHADPRERYNLITDNFEVRRWEVYTCPRADVWNKHNLGHLGLFYCEEHTHAVSKTYFNGKSQSNLSQCLTHPDDNRCMFSLYYRAANLDPAQRAQSFPEGDQPVFLTPKSLTIQEFAAMTTDMALSVYNHLLLSARETAQNEGVCAIALGLREWAETLPAWLKYQADATRLACDDNFLALNFIFPRNITSHSFWQNGAEKDARDILLINLVNPVRVALDLEALA